MTSRPRPVTPVAILAEELDHVAQLLGRVDGVDPDILDRLHRARDLAGGMDPYLDASTTAESPALADLARRTRDADWGDGTLEQEMLSGHVEGQALKMLVRLARASRVLEIGMFTGYSALAAAEAVTDGGEVVACEVDAAVAEFAQQSFDASPVGDRITVYVGPAADTLTALDAENRQFDFVFIDADKSGYLGYLETLLDSTLLAPGAIVAVDNTLLQGEPYLPSAPTANGAAIRDFNRAVADDPRVEQVLLPLRDGLTLIRRIDVGE